VKVREDVTIWSNNETGSFALNRPEPVWVTPLIFFIGRPLEEQIVEWRTLAALVFLRNLNNDDAWRHDFKDLRERVV